VSSPLCLSARSQWSDSELTIGGSHQADLGIAVRVDNALCSCGTGMWAQETTRRNWARTCEVRSGGVVGFFFVCFVRVGDIDVGEVVSEAARGTWLLGVRLGYLGLLYASTV
jgi:hypothetical protein